MRQNKGFLIGRLWVLGSELLKLGFFDIEYLGLDLWKNGIKQAMAFEIICIQVSDYGARS